MNPLPDLVFKWPEGSEMTWIGFHMPKRLGILTHLEFIPQGWIDLRKLLNMEGAE